LLDSKDGLNPSFNTQGQCATKLLDNPLWQYACQFYSQPGVEAALLELQDQQGADINLILQALWLGSLGKAWSSDCIAEPYPLWMAQQIQPLRKMRREMKQAWPEQEAFRQQVKKLELKAEQHALAMLYLTHAAEPAEKIDSDTGLIQQLSATNLDKLAEYFSISAPAFEPLKALIPFRL
jgi:uncharacterized protein (TIGR02444 family)